MKSRRRTVIARGVALGAPLVVIAALAHPLQASAAPTDVVINELMYNPATGNDGDEFLELYNRGSAPVDLSGWSFSGITLIFAGGTTIAANGYLVVSKDATRYQQTYGGTPNAVYTGSLSNGGEAITLKDATAAVIDTVTYSDRAPWPGTPDGEGASLEVVDPAADNTDYLDWAGSTAPSGYTPRAQNSVFRSTGVGPRITGVSASPTSPAPNQAVTVTATVTGQTSVPVVRYRIDFNAEQTIAMTNAGGDVYTANVPGAAAGHLIRYRVAATNAATTSLVPRSDDTTVYQGVVVPSGVSSPIRMLEWFIADADYNTITASPTADIIRKGAIAYNGTVIDNVSMNIRGAGSQTAPKPNWKFELPHNYAIDFGLVGPVDEFGMQGDWSDKSHGRPALSWDAYKRAGVMSATSEQLFPMRTQRNAQFQGFYTYIDLFDGTWRDREGYSGDTQFFKAENGAFDPNRPIAIRFEKKNPDDTDFSSLQSFLSGIALTGNAQRDYLLGNLDIPQVINMLAVTAIIDHEDFSSKNFYFALRSATGRWSMIPWDLDHTWGNGCCGVNSNFVTPAETGDKTNDLARAVLAVPQWREMYFRRLRTLVNDILATGRPEALYDAYMGPAQPVTVQDFSAWPYTGTPTYANQRNALFNAIQARRNAFATDARVPSNQPASPNIVINEIQHSPAAGNGAEFLELENPNATAIDISGWTISDGITLTVQPGTVIPAGGTMTFVSNDLTFKASYGSTVFVGGRFTGDLAASETLTLLRADLSTADSVTYGGAGWPVPTSGQSLELTNPATDNNDGANWALSASPGGSPGAANGGAVVSEPAAPTIGTATPGNASATVTWTAPSNNGGSTITGYNVRVVNNTTNQQVGALRPAGPTDASLLVTGLTNQTAYRLQVAAVNSVSQGPFSALSNIVTPTSGATPAGPPNIGTPSQGAVGGVLSAICRWTPPSSTGGSPITGYQVIALKMSSAAADAVVLSSQTSRVLKQGVRQYDFTLSEGNFRFQVVAINAAGTSPPSARSANVVPR